MSILLGCCWSRANVHAEDDNGRTALCYAVVHNNVAVAEALLEYGADVDKQDDVDSHLGYAIRCRHIAMVALLLRFRANTQETLCHGKIYTAVYSACMYSNVRIVRLLLAHNDGVDVNAFVARDHEYHGSPAMSPLCKACERNNLEMVQLLVQNGARVIFDGVDRHDAPCPLRHAVIAGSMEIIQFLLGKLPEDMDNNSPALSEPLEIALRLNKLEAAQLLLDHGANVNGEPYLPYLYMCAEYWHGEEGIENVVCLLLEKGADVNMSRGGETPLFAAAENGSVALVKMFLTAGAHVNMTNRFGETPLFAAANNGHVQMVKVLIDEADGADVNIRDNHGETPLGAAHRQGHTDVVYLLLRTSPHVWPRLQNVL